MPSNLNDLLEQTMDIGIIRIKVSEPQVLCVYKIQSHISQKKNTTIKPSHFAGIVF